MLASRAYCQRPSGGSAKERARERPFLAEGAPHPPGGGPRRRTGLEREFGRRGFSRDVTGPFASERGSRVR